MTETSNHKIFERLAILVTCLLMLVAIAIGKNGRILGYNLGKQEATADTAEAMTTAGQTLTINTTGMADDVYGYAGPTPLMMYVTEGVIDSITVLENSETPSFLARVKQGILAQYAGKTITEARTLQVDAVSGATMSSRAVMANIGCALDALPQESAESTEASSSWDWMKLAAALVVSLMAAILPLWTKNPKYRIVQLLLNIGILGLYCGTFVSHSSIVSVLSNGLSWTDAALGVLLVVALFYPLFGKRGHYCAWCCPLGSAQELMGKAKKDKWRLPLQWHVRLKALQQVLWGVLIVLAWSGIWLDWMDYELFSAFLWQAASWVVVAVTALFLVLSIFVTRPYCHYVCPTGALLKTPMNS